MADEGSSCSRTRKTQNHDPLSELSDGTRTTVQSLMLLKLGGKYNGDDVSGKRKRVASLGEQEVDQILPNNDITSVKKSKKIYDNDIEVVVNGPRMKKHRSLANIYKATKPIIHPAKEFSSFIWKHFYGRLGVQSMQHMVPKSHFLLHTCGFSENRINMAQGLVCSVDGAPYYSRSNSKSCLLGLMMIPKVVKK
ncbi:hypothetical protein HKD37_06G015823 [Glycine soja]